MKFDYVFMNPPYAGDLHLKIINEFVILSKKVVAIHPGRWAEDVLANYKSKSALGKKYNHLKTAIVQAYFFKAKEGKRAFNMGLDQDMMIATYSNDDENPRFPLYKDSGRFFSILEKIVDYAKVNGKSLCNNVEKNKISGIRVEIKGISPRSHDGDGCMSELSRNSFVYVTSDTPFIDGKNENGEYWLVANGKRQNQYTKGKTEKMFPLSTEFDCLDDGKVFISLYMSNVGKNIIHMLKYDMHAPLDFIPYFDPKVIKNEDDMLDELGIVEPAHREWMKRDVYDYREKDFIRYGENIDC